jgi:FG-GAP-like repeat
MKFAPSLLTLAALLGACGDESVFVLHPEGHQIAIETAASATVGMHTEDVARVIVVGDLDGDGTADAIVITSYYPEDGLHSELHVLYGGGLSGAIDIATLPRLVEDADSPAYTDLIAIEPVGDIDGDGLADFAVSKTSGTACDGYKDSASRDGQHKGVYLVYGSRTRVAGQVPLASIGVTLQDDVTCTGSALQLGRVGDVDGDGRDDLAILDPGRYDSDPARLLVFYGRRFTGTVAFSSADAVITDADLNTKLREIAAVGDVDGDGRADLAISVGDPFGDTAEVRVVYGARFPGQATVQALEGSTFGSDVCPFFATSALGDLDGDGKDDFAVFSCPFAPIWEPPVPTTHHVFYGRDGRFPARVETASADATIAASPGSFSTLTSGDLDGDGHLDLVVSDPELANRGGGVIVILGSGDRLGGPIDLGASTAYVGHEVRVKCINVNEENCTAGQFVGATMAVGDLTGDGHGDILTNAPTTNGVGYGLGSLAYLVPLSNL